MKEQHHKFTVEKIANFLQLSRSYLHHSLHRAASKRALEEAKYLKKIQSIHTIHKYSRYIDDSLRIHAKLKKKGMTCCSRRRIVKSIKEDGIQAKIHQEMTPNYVHRELDSRYCKSNLGSSLHETFRKGFIHPSDRRFQYTITGLKNDTTIWNDFKHKRQRK